jgi:hypothetical protein
MCSPIKTSVKPIFSIFAAKARSAKAPRHSPRPCGIARQQLSRKLLVDREVGDGEASIRPEDTTDLGQDSKIPRYGNLLPALEPVSPQTCGKVERFHQTLKRWLAGQEAAASVRELRGSSTASGATPTRSGRTGRSAGVPAPRRSQLGRRRLHGCRGFVVPTHFRVRRDKVDITGTITLRHNSRPHHIGLGRRLIGTRVLVLVADRDVRVLSEDGELIRRLALDPARDYQPHGRS